MPLLRTPAQQDAARANGARSRGPVSEAGKARARRNNVRHGLCGGELELMPGEDAGELEGLQAAVAADWRPRDAFERHWVAELVAALWRQKRLRVLELAGLAAAAAEQPASEASLKRLVTFARYGARIDKDIGRAIQALRALQGRADADLAEPRPSTCEPDATRVQPRTCEPNPPSLTSPKPANSGTREPELNPAPSLNRQQRRRLEALERRARRLAA